jgi:hypothetical protein
LVIVEVIFVPSSGICASRVFSLLFEDSGESASSLSLQGGTAVHIYVDLVARAGGPESADEDWLHAEQEVLRNALLAIEQGAELEQAALC